MSKRDKLRKRFLSLPQDFTWDELTTLLAGLGFEEIAAGKTSGSRAKFYREDYKLIMLHKPHPGNILKLYQLKEIKTYLQNENLL